MRVSRTATVFCLVALSGTASMATELPGSKGANRSNSSTCAGFGPGFVPVQGSDTCVRVSGHVRVEYGFGRAGTIPNHGSDYGVSSYLQPESLSGDAGAVFGRLKPIAPQFVAPARQRGAGRP